MGVADVNNLSWMLYLADVAGSLDNLFGVGKLLLLIAAILTIIITIFAGDVSFDDDDEGKMFRRIVGRNLVWVVSLALFFSVAAALVPNRETVYAIAASEVGEDVINSPTGSKAVKALEAWLDRQISPPARAPHD